MQRHIRRLLAARILLVKLIAMGYTVAITYIFLMPPSGAKAPFAHADKLVHILIFILFVVLWAMVIQDSKKPIDLTKTILILCAALIYGIIIEALQGLYIVGRQPDVLDVIANVTGSIIGLLCFRLLQNRILK
ncbi:VanZ family protein [Altibacter sp. HG106]|uniref:VanZ family protein n=1 Tax=Altibacter sp. HG106 TaxID=3023937 RepID=UPI00234FFEF0|nr:VanZ family protein [Altibacter sp. HG106]MDC7994655.1 VanZ family protein [Altibacter sp. HG106]